MIRNRMQIQKHKATMAIDTVLSIRKWMEIDESQHLTHRYDDKSSTEHRPQKRGMTVPETKKLLLQTNSAPEVLERLTITTATHQSCCRCQVHQEVKEIKCKCTVSLGVNEKSLVTMLVFITELEAPPNASYAQSADDINGVNHTQC
jgi:hypothetical protein